MKHIFVSYVHQDLPLVDRLCDELRSAALAVWQDKDKLTPGVRWKDRIAEAISDGSIAFVACFSKPYLSRQATYMNEELQQAIEQLRLRPRERAWFFPVSLDGARIPRIPISAIETLNDIHSVDLSRQWDDGVSQLILALKKL